MSFDQLRRRDFITLLGGAAAAWPVAARAQQLALPVIGVLGSGSRNASDFALSAFAEGLRQQGYTEGRNVGIQYSFADGHYDLLPSMAAEFVRRHVAVIVTFQGTPPLVAAKAATTMIPIVFSTGNDPVAQGLVASLNRPGGNATGVATLTLETAPKRLELLHELLPTASTIAVLKNPKNPGNEDELKRLQAAARTLGVQLHVLDAGTEDDFEKLFATASQSQALSIIADESFNSRAADLGALSMRHAIPAIYSIREFSAGGGLISYGSDDADSFRIAGVYAGRILKGDKPADLPVQQATKVDLVINLKAAKALGITVPPTLLGRADEIIE
jgi:putative tryptophan/tyrosine transport system substrate-binding protein